MKYLLFAGYHYYPHGGWKDFRGSFDTVEAARAFADKLAAGEDYFWWHVVDVHHAVPKIILSGSK